MKPIHVLSCLLLATLGGCATHSPRVVPKSVHAGMSGNELLARCGSPVRTHRHPDGREDWYYYFGTTLTPVHLSRESLVIGHIPAGNVVEQ
jgi:hypothetical protein